MIDAELRAAAEALLNSHRPSQPASKIRSVKAVAGGCINNSQIIELETGQQFFLKSNASAPRGMFETESKGLKLLGQSGAIKVPQVIGVGETAKTDFLILESICPEKPALDFSQRFGRQLATLHRQTQTHFGLDHDNYLGATLQPNQQHNDWGVFWKQQRFGFQFQLAQERGYMDATFNKLSDRLLNRVDELLKTNESPALIHGDLWSGNFMVGPSGEPVLIDPAVYFADREAEFGMTTLFGGFDQLFYDAYNEAWPLAAGAEQRIELYRLYHLLNHLNLFGSGYLNDCQAIMKKYS